MSAKPLCGVWIDKSGTAWVSRATADGDRVESTEATRWFAWSSGAAPTDFDGDCDSHRLNGEGVFTHLVESNSMATIDRLAKQLRGQLAIDVVKPRESQFLLRGKQRQFADVKFIELRRCQLDIETASSGDAFSNPDEPEDRVLAIGLRFGDRDRTLVLTEMTDAAERSLLEDLNEVFAEEDPDTIEGTCSSSI